MITFKDLNLPVGTRIQMTIREGMQQLIHYTELIGYLHDEYFILKTPIQNELAVLILVEEPVAFRIFSGKDVIMFSCHVKDIFKSPYFYMHFSCPRDIKVQALRSVVRAKMNFPAQVTSASISNTATITDISFAGAGIIAESMLGNVDGEVLISFTFHTKHTSQSLRIEVKGKIRSIRPLPVKINHVSPQFFHGVLFQQVDSINHLMLQTLVYENSY